MWSFHRAHYLSTFLLLRRWCSFFFLVFNVSGYVLLSKYSKILCKGAVHVHKWCHTLREGIWKIVTVSDMGEGGVKKKCDITNFGKNKNFKIMKNELFSYNLFLFMFLHLSKTFKSCFWRFCFLFLLISIQISMLIKVCNWILVKSVYLKENYLKHLHFQKEIMWTPFYKIERILKREIWWFKTAELKINISHFWFPLFCIPINSFYFIIINISQLKSKN